MAIIAVLNEITSEEKRVAVSVDALKKFATLGNVVRVQAGAGVGAGISDQQLQQAGAEIKASVEECINGAQIVLCVSLLPSAVLEKLAAGAIVVGVLSPYAHRELLPQIAARNITTFAMELMPRISRAQSMDVLSSQANLAGYRAVIEAVAALGKATPMMMTAAGTVPPAKVLVLGAGVAGLQAIATAKRLGCVVYAFDVRPVAKEQVESLGAKFIEVPSEEAANAETSGGYAKEMSEEYKRKQSQLIHDTLKMVDIAISTALIPGKPAPRLITQAMVKDMKKGAVIVDLAAGSGGNCELSKADQVVDSDGVTIIGYTNLPSRVATDAAALYARNLYNFVATFFNKEKQLAINFEDELVKATLLTHQGAVVHPQFK